MLQLYIISSIFIFGIIFGTIAKKLNFPEVTGYLVAGIIMGPCILKVLNFEMVNAMDIFSTIALSFISFMIGAEFKLKYVKKLGKKPFIIGTICSIFTLIVVTIALMLFKCSFSFSLVMGAIASSTAPAAIMMIVKEYKAHGDVTKNMLSVVAIDDVISLLIFGFSMGIAETFNSANASIMGFLNPFKEIAIALIVGTILGFSLGYVSKIFKTHLNTICLIITFVFGIILICNFFNISPLLMCMVTGIVFVNAYNSHVTDKIITMMDDISSPILVIFFVISGASLDFGKMTSCLIITLIFIISRSFGKIIGAILGATYAKSSKKVIKYLGPTLLSQTGLAIGLAIEALKVFPDDKNLMTMIIASSFIFDMVGPLITKSMLKKAGEIK